MSTTRSRRDLVRGIAGAGIALLLTRQAGATQRTGSGVSSGGIGLPDSAIDALYGPGEVTQNLRAYTDPTYGGPIYAGIDDAKRVTFIEVRWESVSQLGGIPEDAAARQVRAMLPEDAVLEGRFTMPATPDGPIALVVERWSSAALGDVLGRDAIAVVLHQQERQQNPGSAPVTAALAATIAVEDSQT